MELEESVYLFGDPGAEMVELVADVERWEASLQGDVQSILGRVGARTGTFLRR